MNRYTVVYERDEDDWWVVSIPDVPGCHTQGRTLPSAEKRIREALAASLDATDEEAERLAQEAVLVGDVRLPAEARRLLDQYADARHEAEGRSALAQDALQAVAVALTQTVGLSLRDAGQLIGLSQERIRQVLERPCPLTAEERSPHANS